MEQSAFADHLPDQAGGRLISIEQIDELNRLTCQAKGIAYLLGRAGEIDPVPEHTRAAGWAVVDLIERIEYLLEALPAQGGRHV